MASIVFVSGLARHATVIVKKIRNKSSKFTWNVLGVLSPLLTSGVTGASKQFSHSWLFTLWVVMGILIGTFFSGELISKLVKPPPDLDRITDVIQLSQEKYTLIFPKGHSYPKSLKDMVAADIHRYSARNWSSTFTKSLQVIEELLEGSMIVPEANIIPMLASNSRYSTIFMWLHSLMVATRATDYAQKNGHAHCRRLLGEEMLIRTHFFHTFKSYQNIRLAAVVQRLFHSGI